MEFAKVGIDSLIALGLGALLALFIPVGIALLWTHKKHERFTTVLVGAATFLLFAIVLEKPIQNVLVFPTQMGLAEHAASRFINARPILWALVVALFPGVFEETGRLVAFKTLLRNRKNRETSISHGIGHGGFEVMFLLGVTYISYISIAMMINTGTFQKVIDQAIQKAPAQADAIYAQAAQIAAFSFADLGLGIVERIFAVLFHIGASIIVFYACRDKQRFWLYPLAIVLHTAMDFVAALQLGGTIHLSQWAFEGILAVIGILVFCGAYFLLYKKDTQHRTV